MGKHRHTVRVAFDMEVAPTERGGEARDVALKVARDALSAIAVKNVRVLDVGCGDEALMDSPAFDFNTADKPAARTKAGQE